MVENWDGREKFSQDGAMAFAFAFYLDEKFAISTWFQVE